MREIGDGWVVAILKDDREGKKVQREPNATVYVESSASALCKQIT